MRYYKVTGVQTCALPISACSKCSAITQSPNSLRVMRLTARPVLPPGKANSASHSPTQKSSWRYSAVEQGRSEEHTSELQSPCNLVCRLLLEKKQSDSSKY